MIRIGLTGSIGTGKSTVARLATERLGIAVFDADKTVHDLYAHDKELQAFLVEKCGADIIRNGDVDRQKLAQFMRDEEKQKTWREILTEVYYRLWKTYDAFVDEQKAKGAKFIIGDVPLLFESGAENHFDYTINVFLPYDVQKKRALAREKPRLTEAEFEKRYKSFMPTEQRNKKANFAIDNSGEIEASLLQLRLHLSNMRDPETAPPSPAPAFNKAAKIAAVYVGSFDPMTLGHIDVVKSASKLCPKLYVAIGINPDKKPMFTTEERLRMIEREMDRDVRPYLPEGHEIIVTSYEGLTVDFMKKVGAGTCIRGLRGIKDLEEEGDLAAVNKELWADSLDEPGMEEFTQAYFASNPARRHVSSSMARALCGAGRDLALLKFVSADVAVKMIEKRELAAAHGILAPEEAKKIQALWQEFAPQKDKLAQKNYNQLARKYGEAHRKYHNLEHLSEVFAHFEKHRDSFRDPQAVALALFFHDVIYDVARNDNEERSAELARKALAETGAAPGLIDRVVELINMTAAHTAPASDTDAALMMDIDMAILGAAPARYRKYAAAIEAEYTTHYPQQDYRAERLKFLSRHKEDRFFITDAFQNKYGAQANRNLTWEENHLVKAQAGETPRKAPRPGAQP